MKKGYLYLLILFIGVLVFVSACTKKVSICGNGICESTENCQCSDCASESQCKQDLSQQCDDLNECTSDFYDENTKSCAHTALQNCCGNGKCEGEERNCDLSTYTTKCAVDCKFNCPASLVLQRALKDNNDPDGFPYSCSENCEEVNINNFKLTNKIGSIKTVIKNIGEITSGTVTSSFYCYREGNPSNKVVKDNDSLNGVLIRDYFDDNKDVVNIKGRVVGNNTATYYLKFDFSEIQQDGITFTCSVSLDDSIDQFKNSQEIFITFYK